MKFIYRFRFFFYFLAFFFGILMGEKAFAQMPGYQVYPVPMTATLFNGASTGNPTFAITSNFASSSLNFQMSTAATSAENDNVFHYTFFGNGYSLQPLNATSTYTVNYTYNITTGQCVLGWAQSGMTAGASGQTNMAFGTVASISTLSGSGSGSSTRAISFAPGLYISGVNSQECDGVIIIDSLTVSSRDLASGSSVERPLYTILNGGFGGSSSGGSSSGGSSPLTDEQFDGFMWLLGFLVAIFLVTGVIGLFYKK